jgi:hypothetical protein
MNQNSIYLPFPVLYQFLMLILFSIFQQSNNHMITPKFTKGDTIAILATARKKQDTT